VESTGLIRTPTRRVAAGEAGGGSAAWGDGFFDPGWPREQGAHGRGSGGRKEDQKRWEGSGLPKAPGAHRVVAVAKRKVREAESEAGPGPASKALAAHQRKKGKRGAAALNSHCQIAFG
jgi:hypothetical protein